MKVLIAEDDEISRTLLETVLTKLGFEVTATANGAEAIEALREPDAPSLALLDLMMPVMDGIEVCKWIRESANHAESYVIFLTARSSKEDIVRGLAAGANDYLTKPFDISELQARITVGSKVVELQHNLAHRVAELEQALEKVKRLQGLLPICSHCKRIRDDDNYWQSVDHYITQHSEAVFSHSICPECYAQYMEPELRRLKEERNTGQLADPRA
jgi:sigma-B regulation protein RsbU (phosphoserine phosphatase)